VDGYNADARPVMDDVNTSPTFTHDITLGSVPVVNLTGVDYYEFLLDINQQNSDPLLSLDELQIYTRAGAIGVGDNLATLAGSSDLRYDLDGAGDSEVLLNYNLNSGSGSGDLFVYIPKSLFAGDPNTDFVYLYSQFGASTTPPPNWENNDGFEEWAVRTTNPVPDGGLTIALLGFSLTGLGVLRRKLAAR